MKRGFGKKELSQEQIDYLVFNSDLLSAVRMPFASEQEAHRAYTLHEDELLEEYTAWFPGCRPRRWWNARRIERKILGQASSPLPYPRVGFWRTYPVVECQYSCLKRLELLLPGEGGAAMNEPSILAEIENKKRSIRDHEQRVLSLDPKRFV